MRINHLLLEIQKKDQILFVVTEEKLTLDLDYVAMSVYFELVQMVEYLVVLVSL